MKQQSIFNFTNDLFIIIAPFQDGLEVQCVCGKWNKATAWSCKSCGKALQ